MKSTFRATKPYTELNSCAPGEHARPGHSEEGTTLTICPKVLLPPETADVSAAEIGMPRARCSSVGGAFASAENVRLVWLVQHIDEIWLDLSY